MASRWFRLPETGDGTAQNPFRPDLFGHSVDGYAGNTAHPNGPPAFVVRVYADTATLDSLAAESQAVELGSVPVTALNQMFGQQRDDSGWRGGFTVG